MGDADRTSERLVAPRFFVAPSALAAGRIAFDSAQQRQISRVLRLRDGEQVVVCDGTGDEIIVTVRHEAGRTWGETGLRKPGGREPRRSVWLYASALRGDRFTWLLQKATEIGVRGIMPVRYHYTQQADYAGRLDRYQAVVREAAEQCERSLLPELLPVRSFAEAMAHSNTRRGALRVLLDEQEHDIALNDLVQREPVGAVCLFVGPEGGLSDDERAAARQEGLTAATLGPRILRSETAGLVALTLSLAAGGDLA